MAKKAKKKKPPEKSKGGRPEYEPSEEHRKIIELMAAGGIQQEHIAKCYGISINTLKKYYGDQLETGKTKLDGEVVGQLVKQIRTGNVACIIFYMKTRMGWKEDSATQGDDDTPTPVKVEVTVKDARKAKD